MTLEQLGKIIAGRAMVERCLEAKAGNNAIEAQYRSAKAEAYEEIAKLLNEVTAHELT